jgi:hypothetical protein
MNGLNNDPDGPTVDHLPERPWNGRSASSCGGLGANALPFRSALRNGLRDSGAVGLLATPALERSGPFMHR